MSSAKDNHYAASTEGESWLGSSDVPSPKNPPTATEQVFNGYPLNADVAPIANPFFQPLLTVVGRCWFNGYCWKCNRFINLLNLKLNLLDCNGFATGHPSQPVGHPLRQQRVPFLMTNIVEQSISVLGTGATGDESCWRTALERQDLGKKRHPFFFNGTVVGFHGTVARAKGDK